MKYDIPLIAALIGGHPTIAHQLIDLGEAVNIVVEDGETPLFFAVQYESVLCHLLQAGANPAIANCYGDTPLHVVAEAGTAQEAISLLLYGANIEARNHRGQTPLHNAVVMGNLSVVDVLIQRGANVNAHDSEGYTPLHWVVNANIERHKLPAYLEITRLLLKAGADTVAKNLNHQTPLDLAKQAYGYPELTHLLTDYPSTLCS